MSVKYNPKLFNLNNTLPIPGIDNDFIVYYKKAGSLDLSKIFNENVGIGIYNYYVDVMNWKYVGIFISLYDNVTVKMYVSGQFDKEPKDCNYIDMTLSLMNVSLLQSNDNHLLNLDTPFSFRWIKIEATVSAILNKFGVWIQKST